MHGACAVVDRTRVAGRQLAGTSAQLADTYASAGSMACPSTTMQRWSASGQLVVSAAMRQHGWLVADVSSRLHAGKLRPGAGTWLSIALTVQSYCGPAIPGSSSRSLP
jgi:hypothetical protein